VHHKKLVGQINCRFLSCKKNTTKKKYKYIHLERKNIKKCSKNCVFHGRIKRSLYQERMHKFPPRTSLEGVRNDRLPHK
jgi:hypothetical protein